MLRRMRLHLKAPTRIALDETRYKMALEEARNLNLSYSTKVEKLQMVEINDDLTIVKDVEEFSLGSS